MTTTENLTVQTYPTAADAIAANEEIIDRFKTVRQWGAFPLATDTRDGVRIIVTAYTRVPEVGAAVVFTVREVGNNTEHLSSEPYHLGSEHITLA